MSRFNLSGVINYLIKTTNVQGVCYKRKVAQYLVFGENEAFYDIMFGDANFFYEFNEHFSPFFLNQCGRKRRIIKVYEARIFN